MSRPQIHDPQNYDQKENGCFNTEIFRVIFYVAFVTRDIFS